MYLFLLVELRKGYSGEKSKPLLKILVSTQLGVSSWSVEGLSRLGVTLVKFLSQIAEKSRRFSLRRKGSSPWGWPGGGTWKLNWVKGLGQCRNLRDVWETEADTELKHKSPNFHFMLSIRTTFIPVQILKHWETLLLERSSHWRPFAKGRVLLAWATTSNLKPFYLLCLVTFFLASFHSER